MQIDITTMDRLAGYYLLGENKNIGPDPIELAPGVSAKFEGTTMQKSAEITPETTTFLINVAANVTGTLIACAIWDWMKKGVKQPPEKITIDKCEVEFEEGAIKRLVIERVEKRQSRSL